MPGWTASLFSPPTASCRTRVWPAPTRACGESREPFGKQKSTLAVRPIYHQREDTSIGHIVAALLALRLEVDLQRRLHER